MMTICILLNQILPLQNNIALMILRGTGAGIAPAGIRGAGAAGRLGTHAGAAGTIPLQYYKKYY